MTRSTMNTEGHALLSPVKLGDVELANRVVMAPLTRARAGESRVPNEIMAEYYRQRAGAGLIITEATTVMPSGNGWVNSPGVYTDEQGRGWKAVVEAVREEGGKIFLQLWHTGRAGHSSFLDGELPVAPSAVAINGEGVHTAEGKLPHETPRALETDEIPGIVQAYADATRRAKEAGFDGVEVHAANGYLLDQFLQSKTNHRTDAYGGSVENRFRLLREVVEAVSDVIGGSRVGVRLAPNGVFNDMGSPDYREQFTFVARELDKLGLAYLHVMDGLAFGFHELGEPMTLEEFRPLFRGALMGNCGYTLEAGDAAIEAGHADVIAYGRPFISNPDLVDRLRNGWPLAPDSDPSTWYSGTHAAEGYTDFPTYGTASDS